jgi:phage terminase large subunit GpA-like protein
MPKATPLNISRFGLSDYHINTLDGYDVDFDIPTSLKFRLRKPRKIKVSDWAEQHRVVTDGAHDGPWRHEYAPHTVKIMDTFGLPWVREIWFCGVEQSGKTNTMINCIGWAIDRSPGDIFYLMPTEETAAKVTGGKLIPTLKRSPELAQYVSERVDDTTMTKIVLKHGVTIHPAHSNSPSSLATFTAKYCFCDETDKYPAMAGKEADPITLIKKRNRTFKGRYKRFFASTPAQSYIWKGAQDCHQLYEYRLKCPDCGELIHADAEHLDIPKGITPEQAELTPIGYVCNECAAVWDEAKREKAIRGGKWVCIKGQDELRPAKVGFHHRAWDCLDITLSEIAAAWLKSKTGDMVSQIAWANGYEAENYAPEIKVQTSDAILRLRDDRPEGLIPSVPVAAITGVFDMQKRGFWYSIRAWGFGLEQESWQLKYGYVESWNALQTILWESEFKDMAGKSYQITYRLGDSGGGESEGDSDLSRTAESYLFACKNPGLLLWKGKRVMTSKFQNPKTLDRLPGTNKPLPGSPLLYVANVTHYKDRLAAKLQIEPCDPGAWHLHKDASENFARQMTAEYKDGSYWECAKNKDNHLWDCSVMELALVDFMGVNTMRPASNKPKEHRPVVTETRALPNWFNKRR